MATEISRRRLLQLTGVGAMVAGTAAFVGCNSSDANNDETTDDQTAQTTGVTLEVLDPAGSVAITQHFVDRLDTLEGKTIAFVTNDDWESDRTFPLIADLLTEKYPGITIIREDNFARGVNDITKDDNGIAEVMQSMGVDGAIVGNAG